MLRVDRRPLHFLESWHGLLGLFRSASEMGTIFSWLPPLFLSVECRFKWERHNSVTNALASRKNQKWQISLAALTGWMSNILKQLGGIQGEHIPTVIEKNIFAFLYHYPEQIPTTPITLRHLRWGGEEEAAEAEGKGFPSGMKAKVFRNFWNIS